MTIEFAVGLLVGAIAGLCLLRILPADRPLVPTCCCPCGCDYPTAQYRGLCAGCAEDEHYEDDAA